MLFVAAGACRSFMVKYMSRMALCRQWVAFHASHLNFVQVSGLRQFCDAIASTLKRHKRRFARSANHLSLLVESGARYIGEKRKSRFARSAKLLGFSPCRKVLYMPAIAVRFIICS
jgi:argininosuccinate lyase